MNDNMISGFITLIDHGMSAGDVEHHADTRFKWDDSSSPYHEPASGRIVDRDVEGQKARPSPSWCGMM
jgi:hypothetical protein